MATTEYFLSSGTKLSWRNALVQFSFYHLLTVQYGTIVQYISQICMDVTLTVTKFYYLPFLYRFKAPLQHQNHL